MAIRPVQSKKLVNQISRNIRRTLDLDTIWQQTVDSLGEALGVATALFVPTNPTAYRCKWSLSILRTGAVNAGSRTLHCQCSCLSGSNDAGTDCGRADRRRSSLPAAVAVGGCYLLSGPTECLISLHQCVSASSVTALPDKETRQWTAAEIELVRVGRSGWDGDRPPPFTKSWNSHAFKRRNPRLKSEFLANTSTNFAPLSTVCSGFKSLEGMADGGAAGIYRGLLCPTPAQHH